MWTAEPSCLPPLLPISLSGHTFQKVLLSRLCARGFSTRRTGFGSTSVALSASVVNLNFLTQACKPDISSVKRDFPRWFWRRSGSWVILTTMESWLKRSLCSHCIFLTWQNQVRLTCEQCLVLYCGMPSSCIIYSFLHRYSAPSNLTTWFETTVLQKQSDQHSGARQPQPTGPLDTADVNGPWNKGTQSRVYVSRFRG